MAAEDQKDETPESQSETDVSAAVGEPAEMDRKGLLGRKVGMTQILDLAPGYPVGHFFGHWNVSIVPHHVYRVVYQKFL